MSTSENQTDRRKFLGQSARVVGALSLVGVGEYLAARAGNYEELVWQLNPDKCIACGNCATKCVLDVSAVKCLNCFDICGYCDGCTGFYESIEGINPRTKTTAPKINFVPPARSGGDLSNSFPPQSILSTPSPRSFASAAASAWKAAPK